MNRDLIKLIEEYAGSLEDFPDIENVSLYHDLAIYGDDAEELLTKYSFYSMSLWMNFILMTIFRKKGIRYSV